MNMAQKLQDHVSQEESVQNYGQALMNFAGHTIPGAAIPSMAHSVTCGHPHHSTSAGSILALFLARTGSSKCHNADGFHTYQLSMLRNFPSKEEDKGGTTVHPVALVHSNILLVLDTVALSKIQSPDQDLVEDKSGIVMLIIAHIVNTGEALSPTD